MSIKVVCIRECKGKDISATFKVGDILHQSEVPLDCHLSLIILFRVNPADYCVIDEDPKRNGEWCIWLKSSFAPISDIDETEMKRDYQRVDQSLQKCVKR